MEFLPEEKLEMEKHLKVAMKEIVEALVLAGGYVAKKTENKIDDVAVPLAADPAKAALFKLIEEMKL